MSSTAYIALDLGTSFIKAALVYPAARRVAHISRRPFPEPLPGRPALWVELDPNQIAAAVRSLVEELAPFTPDCGGVLLCGQMSGLVLTSATGQALSPYISWRDQRLGLPASGGGTYWDRLLERLSADDRRQLGQEVRPGIILSYLFWLAQERQLPAGQPYAATLLDFVLANLCGAPPVMEPTAAVGLLNMETGGWHEGVFDQLGLGGVRWPALGDFRTVVGQVAVDGRRLPCYAAVGDQQCALVGAGVSADELSLNISTGSQASRTTPTLTAGPYQTRPFFDGQFVNTITHIPAGRALNVLLALATELGGPADGRDPWPYLHQAAVAVGDTDLQVDLAFFPSPVGQRGAITNIHTDNLTLGHLFRAALRNMADNYQTIARRLAPAQDWQTLVFSGGLAHHLPLLRELIVERLPGPARLSPVTEDTLTGLLALTLVLSGEASSVAAAAADLRASPPVIE